MAITYMTQEGYDKKMAELSHLENVERPEVVRAIVEARDKGDLSEMMPPKSVKACSRPRLPS